VIKPQLNQQNQRGDTLVEVTIALAILVMVLLSSFNLASYAFRLGEQAKERTQASQLAQEQAEALRNYRDNHPWLNNGVPTTCDDLKMGFYSNVQSAGCQTNHEFHFELIGGAWSWVAGRYNAPSLNSQASLFRTYITVEQLAALPNTMTSFRVTTKWPPIGGLVCPSDPDYGGAQTCVTSFVTRLTRTDNFRASISYAGDSSGGLVAAYPAEWSVTRRRKQVLA
jgi:Tfp pilus assembly protein PilV